MTTTFKRTDTVDVTAIDICQANMNEPAILDMTLLRAGQIELYRKWNDERESVLLATTSLDTGSGKPCVLRSEHELKETLAGPWALQPLRLSHRLDQIQLTLADPGGYVLRESCGAPLAVDQFLILAIALARAVSAMHAQGVVHRDLAPENVLFNWRAERAWLTGLGNAMVLAADDRSLTPLSSTSLNYLAPELCGTINRPVDGRADLYSLGCVLYELATGSPPVSVDDLPGAVHSHLAMLPLPASAARRGYPEVLSQVIATLMAKDPNDRYSSAEGLLGDLLRCHAAWREHSHLRWFPIDHANAARRLNASNRIYGRVGELDAVRDTFQDVATDRRTRCVALFGESGTGKSAVVRDFERTLDKKTHSFGAGRCGQVEDTTPPYACLAMALQDLLHNKLRDEGQQFTAWSRKLRNALGSSIGLLHTLVPDLNLIVDDIPYAASEAAPADRDRLVDAVCKFIACFSADRGPLVLFLDDLQWADSGTLTVAQRLLQSKDLCNLLLIFASRGEGSHAPQHVRSLLNCSSVPVTEITLGPLAFVDVNRLVSDILGCSPATSVSLSALIQTKTGANPFFVIRFMSMLLDEGIIWFASASSSWRWDLSKVRASKYTSNVAELLLDKLATLPVVTLNLLQCMACLGDSSPAQMLALAAEIEEHSVHTLLVQAERAGLVRRNASAYSFLHDRIREAAYHSLVRDQRHKEMHVTVGKRLARVLPEQREMLFAAANQINLGAELIDGSDDKLRYARLNLDAAIVAKKSADYRAAITYLRAAAFLLRDVEDLTIAGQIEFHTAECEFVTADLAGAEARLERLWSSDIDIVLKSRVARLRAALYTAQGRQRTAVDIGLSYLAQLGLVVPGKPCDEDVARDRAKLIQYIDCTGLDSGAQQRATASPLWAGAMDVLGDLITPALFCNNENLVHSLVFTMALMTVDRGYCGASSYAFVHAASILAFRFRDVERGLLLGKKALQLSSEDGFDRLAARVGMCFGALVIPWTRPVRSAQRYIKDAVKAAYNSCDLMFAVYSQRNLISNLLFVGAPLAGVMRVTEEAVDFARSAGFQIVVDTLLAQLMVVSTLRGTYGQTFESKGLESDWSESLIHGVACTSPGAFAFWVHRLQICVLFRDWEGALEAERKATGLLGASLAHIETADLPYYGALCRAAAFFRATEEGAREAHLGALRDHHNYLQLLAESCPDNFADRAALVAAELARVQGRIGDAQLLYEKAIELARKQGFVQNEAVALETAANFYATQNLSAVAETLLGNARYAYLHWGAEGKAQEVESRMAGIIGLQRAKPSSDTGRVHLDTRAVVTASHALSSEIVLPRLLEVLIGNVLEHAGAQRCAVALHRNGEFRIEAEARAALDGLTYVVESRQLQEVDLPLGILMTVARTRQKVLLDDATRSGEFAQDRDVIQRGLRSVLCMPLLKQSELVGILYVENNLISGAFTEEKTTLLEVFASQAAISVENARLYADTVQSNSLREAAERELRDSREELARVASLTTMGQLVASITHEVSQPLVSIATSAGAALRFMRRDEPDFVEVEEALKRIQFDSTRAHDVVRSLRALAKRSAPSFSAFNLHDAIEEALLLTRSQLEKHAIRVDSHAISGTSVVWGDRVQIQQVVLNLVVNAIEAMHEITDRERRLFLGSSTVEGHVKLVIEDTGVGIEEDSADHIFAPFVTTKSHGMGMGLPICRSIVQAHAGRLTVEPLSPYGTRFEVRLPEPGRRPSTQCGPST